MQITFAHLHASHIYNTNGEHHFWSVKLMEWSVKKYTNCQWKY
jgi:hypothetical protein